MASGMEMMINALIKATGIKPDEVVKQFSDAQKLLVESVQNFDERLSAIERIQQEIFAMLEDSMLQAKQEQLRSDTAAALDNIKREAQQQIDDLHTDTIKQMFKPE